MTKQKFHWNLQTTFLLGGARNLHLETLTYFAAEANERQNLMIKASSEKSPKEIYNEIFPKVQSCVLATIVCSFAFLEESINHFFGRCTESNDGDTSLITLGILTKAQLHTIQMAYAVPGFDRLETIKKYDEALRLTSKKPFDRSREPSQSMEILRRFRNCLMHYKYHSQEENQREVQLISKALKDRKITPYTFDTFPDCYLTSATASWAATTATQFFLLFVQHLTES